MPLFRQIILCVMLVASLGSVSHSADGIQEVVVLRNGNILRGTVQKLDNRLRVVSVGSEIDLLTADVDFQCDSIESAYQLLRKRLVPPTAVGHLQLAAWCVRHELWEAAETQLAAARLLEPNHPRLTILEQTTAHLRRIANSEPKADDPSNVSSPQPPNQVTVTAGASGELLAELPDRALEDFTRRVQPILVNNCTTSGCHSVGGPQRFQLNRDLLHGMANRRSTTRNLSATLMLVNADAPLDSELLARASAAHAGMETPPLPIHQSGLHKRLEEWVLLVSGKESAEPATPDAAVRLAVGEGEHVSSVNPASGDAIPRADNSIDPTDIDFEAMLATPQSNSPRFGGQLKAWTPRDEFDPEIFNRMQSAAEAANSGTAIE